MNPLSRKTRARRARFFSFVDRPRAPAVATAVFAAPRGLSGAARTRRALAGALVVAGATSAWAILTDAPPRSQAAPAPDRVVELFDPPPPPPPPPAEPEPPPPPRPRSAPKAAPAPTPAQAAAVVAREPTPEAPLDLTAFSLPTGQAASYAGGKTAASGTSTRAVTGAASQEGVADGTGDDPAGDLSAPVSLRGDEWDCPWPAEAEALGIDEETVVIEVTADDDGRVESARLIRDPGHGFGPATLACARQTRFEPARDRAGRAVPARSGPIRVRFWR